MVDDERFVETDQLWRDKRGVIVRVVSYDRKERQVLFIRPNWPNDVCTVPKWLFEQNFRKYEGKGEG
ncbi:hypothetical protein WB66_05190 [bacteria symbiont BFo1 of Frankliniella occidentalis]|nr:hypothetical protein AI28_06875 [bacteria symbiont BFo1 of Frankliniella occidentalis]KYP85889.1 hypothetical protein WB66_05190 [bacteria symbiont BFo1 of Frankliniella occidentalis]